MTLHATEHSTPPTSATEIEYGVRTRDGLTGDETVVGVGDEVLMRQTVAELLSVGEPAMPVFRTVTAWQSDETSLARVRRERAREAILATAQRYWEEEIDEAAALDELREHAPTMSDHERAERLGKLISELEHQDDVTDRRVTYSSAGEYDLLVDTAEENVNKAADRLYGGAR